ncbi:hypothetical protein ABZ027_08255 [Streptomyces sp. NPDC006332]|uniref:hypothetical protein n=1 Tax=Streptomyces sp. NPDC006332 TaxID=3155456 RepID=UPI0033A70687
MNLKKIRAKKAADRRHRQLLLAANHVVNRSVLDRSVEQAAPAEIAAIAFGRYELRISDDEALDYLNAVLAERGCPLRTADTNAPEDVA